MRGSALKCSCQSCRPSPANAQWTRLMTSLRVSATLTRTAMVTSPPLNSDTSWHTWVGYILCNILIFQVVCCHNFYLFFAALPPHHLVFRVVCCHRLYLSCAALSPLHHCTVYIYNYMSVGLLLLCSTKAIHTRTTYQSYICISSVWIYNVKRNGNSAESIENT